MHPLVCTGHRLTERGFQLVQHGDMWQYLLKFYHLRHKVITTSCAAANLIVLLTERGKPWIWTRRWTEAISDSLSIILSHDWRVWIRSAFSSQRSQLSQPKLQVTARPEDLESNAGSRRSTQSKASRASRASKGSNASRRVLALTAGCLFELFLDRFCWFFSTPLWLKIGRYTWSLHGHSNR